MPSLDIPTDNSNAFTVINHEDEKHIVKHVPLPRIVNVVKPLQHDDGRTHLPSATKEQLTEKMVAAVAPQTILDPKFTRALDFKLRRLKEKEILEANLRRPTRHRRRAGGLATSNPNLTWKDQTPPKKMLSQSQPRIDIISSECERTKISPKIAKSPSTNKNRSKVSGTSEGDKPRFVTTVKTGQFLLPPPDVACLLGLETLYPAQEREKIVYSYASKPKAVTNRSKRSVPEKKVETIPNGVPPGINNEKRVSGGEVFRGVRALIAGVAGVKHLLEEHDHVGSMATGATGATGNTGYSNVMHDKRVVRGSTFGAHPHAAGDGLESGAARAARTRRRALARRAALARLRPGTPPPAPGRRHHPIQTEYYLEELFDKGVEMEVGVQTDLFVDRPATPIYVPAKTGADASTQIQPGDLFDFDLEVQPILEVLIGKTTEQALAEVAQEEELATLREQQRRYRELRDAELAERQRLELRDERLNQEKERRVAEARAARVAGEEARARVAAATLVQGYVAELLPAVLAGLRDSGYLVRRMRRGVEEEFMPWLIQEVSHEIESIITSRDVIAEIVRDVVETRAELLGTDDHDSQRVSPPDSITPPSAPSEEEPEE
ncbi:radial spoke head protein 3 homolog [Vanessa atalanta]|uniref:radial spoke head protein 3 homolog n=1 Tax=Vanessa atalanta TaxID=42275 RepID=UPI001FCD0332|nr:radial spoke head protein 3 homolog [Vanessa atalanta]